MDSNSSVSLRSANNFIKSSDFVEKELKQRLKWNKQEWSSSGEMSSRMHRLCNSMHYWKEKLKPAMEDKAIIVTFYNEEHNVKIELMHVIEEIEKLDKDFVIQGIANFRNPRYVGLYFVDKEIRDKVVEQFKMLDNNYVIYLSWALKSVSSVDKITVHWLPLTIELEVIKQKLDQYVEIVDQEKKNLVFLSGRKMPTAKIELKVKYKTGVTAEKIPHLMEMFEMETLITISGRKPMCLNCNQLGHISKECEMRHCNNCRALKPRKHECIAEGTLRSYAETVKETDPNKADGDPDKFDDNEIFINKQIVNKDSVSIENKIVLIQNQLKIIDSEVEALESERDGIKSTVENDESKKDSFLNEESRFEDWAEDEYILSDSSMDQSLEQGSFNAFQKINRSKAKQTGEEQPRQVGIKRDLKKTENKKVRLKETIGVTERVKLDADIIEGETINKTKSSYGKPLIDKVRRRRENLKFDKLLEK